MLRIAQVAPLHERVPPRLYGGTERVVASLTDELVRRGHQVQLIPDASGNRVTLDRPRLPSWLGWLELRGLRVAKSRIDLRVTQGRESTAVELLARDGDVEVVVRR